LTAEHPRNGHIAVAMPDVQSGLSIHDTFINGKNILRAAGL